jgi:hypothetical protein
MTLFSIPSRFASALSLLAVMAASGPHLSLAEVISSDFTAQVEVEGRETPFTTRQLELIASEFETIFNAVSDDARLSFVTCRQEEVEEEEEEEKGTSDNNGHRQLQRTRSIRRSRYYRWYFSGRARCEGCKFRPPREDRRLGGPGNAASIPAIDELIPEVSDMFLKKLDVDLQELLDGITGISWA